MGVAERIEGRVQRFSWEEEGGMASHRTASTGPTRWNASCSCSSVTSYARLPTNTVGGWARRLMPLELARCSASSLAAKRPTGAPSAMGPLRSTYSLERRTEPFYTGGAVVADGAGALLACACGDETKLVTLATGSVVRVRGQRARFPSRLRCRSMGSITPARPTPYASLPTRRYGAAPRAAAWDAVVATGLVG